MAKTEKIAFILEQVRGRTLRMGKVVATRSGQGGLHWLLR
jgi:hypothetical protein